MEKFENLTETNVANYQMKHYDNPQCHSMEEFLDDMKRIKYVKRLFHKYHTKGVLKERLIINHLVILLNVLDTIPCNRVLFLKIDEEQHYILATFLDFLNRLPNKIEGINGKVIDSSMIERDNHITQILGEI